MLKETETVKTISFLVTFLSLATFQLGGGRAPGPPLATPMQSWYLQNHLFLIEIIQPHLYFSLLIKLLKMIQVNQLVDK